MKVIKTVTGPLNGPVKFTYPLIRENYILQDKTTRIVLTKNKNRLLSKKQEYTSL